MRLAVVISHPIQYYSPIFRELARRLDLHVFYGQSPSPERQAVGFGQPFQWDVDLLSGYESSVLTNVARDPSTDRFFGCDTPDVGRRLREGRFDAVLVAGWYLKSLIQATWAARRLGIPVMARGDSQLGPAGARSLAKAVTYPALLRAFDAALYVGGRSQAFYEAYHYPKERLFFSPHCVDTDWFGQRATSEAGLALRRRLGLLPDDKAILFAGKLLPIKRPLDIVDAWPRMGPRPQILIAGSGELEETLAARAGALGAPLHRLGFLNQSEMPAAYAAADLLVLPSRSETWGLVANEALACGTPIAVSDACGCAPDLAGDGAAGRVFPMGDVAALARTVDEVLSHPPLSADISARSAAYSVAAAADGIEAAMAALARRPSDRMDVWPNSKPSWPGVSPGHP